MSTDVKINNYLAATIESVFTEMTSSGHEEIYDALVYLYNFVKNEGIYPPQVVEGFYSAMTIISCLTSSQFCQIKSLFV